MSEEKILYNMYELNSNKKLYEKFNFYIIFYNDEERSLAVLKKLHDKKIEIDKLLIISYTKENKVSNKTQDFFNYYENYKIITINDYNDKNYSINFIANLTKENIIGIIGFDMSCCPIPYFFILLKYLSKSINEIIIHYTEPVNYLTKNGLFNRHLSNIKYVKILEIDGFPGKTANNDNQERTSFYLLGFDQDIFKTIRDESSPKKIYIINGFPAFFPKFKDISLVNNENVLYGDIRADNLNKFIYVEANNPYDILNTLCEFKNKEECKDKLIDVVPMGTKPMALGVCLFAIFNKDIRVIYPFSKIETNQTQGCGKSWEYLIYLK
jgi:hypothetical protein